VPAVGPQAGASCVVIFKAYEGSSVLPKLASDGAKQLVCLLHLCSLMAQLPVLWNAVRLSDDAVAVPVLWNAVRLSDDAVAVSVLWNAVGLPCGVRALESLSRIPRRVSSSPSITNSRCDLSWLS
jgi:hypothetical protein